MTNLTIVVEFRDLTVMNGDRMGTTRDSNNSWSSCGKKSIILCKVLDAERCAHQNKFQGDDIWIFFCSFLLNLFKLLGLLQFAVRYFPSIPRC